MNILPDLFLSFAKVGLFTFGGGYAMIALIESICPSFCIIFAISRFLDHFPEITWIAHAFQGIKIAVGILILDAAGKMLQKMQKISKNGISPIMLICISAIPGAVVDRL